MSKQRILAVDDDRNIARLIELYLAKEGYDVRCAYDGNEGLMEFEAYAPHLVILDLMLPGIDGYEMCRRIRGAGGVPIIMLTARGEVFDRVLGLELGADDYMIKPFDGKELVARVKAVLRRGRANKEAGSVAELPNLAINPATRTVEYHGEELNLPPKEFELLLFLAARPNLVFTRDQLLDQIWGYDFFGDSRTVDVHVKRLREKMSKGDEWGIKTVWGVGYKLETKD